MPPTVTLALTSVKVTLCFWVATVEIEYTPRLPAKFILATAFELLTEFLKLRVDASIHQLFALNAFSPNPKRN